jgi:hypothetical protein
MSKMRPPAVAEWQDWPGDAGHVADPADATLISTEAAAAASNLLLMLLVYELGSVGSTVGPMIAVLPSSSESTDWQVYTPCPNWADIRSIHADSI